MGGLYRISAESILLKSTCWLRLRGHQPNPADMRAKGSQINLPCPLKSGECTCAHQRHSICLGAETHYLIQTGLPYCSLLPWQIPAVHAPASLHLSVLVQKTSE